MSFIPGNGWRNSSRRRSNGLLLMALRSFEPLASAKVDTGMDQDTGHNSAIGNLSWVRELARAFAGAAIFALPLLMTMEMWWLGFYADQLRLSLFLLLSLPLLIGLAYYSGIRDAFDWKDDVVDAFMALAIGGLSSVISLNLFGILTLQESLADIVGIIAIQTVPAAMGAVLAREQLGRQDERKEEQKEEVSYFGSLFLMAAGALYLAFNLAPTEEMVLIAFKMTAWHGVILALLSVVVLHAFVYQVGFYGQEKAEVDGFWPLLVRYSITGYAVTLLVCAYILWTFDRFSGLGLADAVMATVVLGFPGALGAAAARLIL